MMPLVNLTGITPTQANPVGVPLVGTLNQVDTLNPTRTDTQPSSHLQIDVVPLDLGDAETAIKTP
jgi:hypothetical protein